MTDDVTRATVEQMARDLDREPEPLIAQVDRLDLLRLHLERRCSSAPLEVAEAFAHIDRLTAERSRLVVEAREQRERADALEAERDRLREAISGAINELAESGDARGVAGWLYRVLAAAQPPAAGTEGTGMGQ